MTPLIGITTARDVSEKTGWVYIRAYEPIIQAVIEAGGLPVLIPVSAPDETVRKIYERLDGVLLPGGGDVRPGVYGADTHPAVRETDEDRDRVELALARWAMADDLPVFGICRGHQVLNVALGGTLIQDIPSQVDSTLNHNLRNPRTARAHEVEVDPGSRLASILGKTRVAVNSLHHQSVEQAAPDACVVAYAPDGVVEALELPDRRFALSVQWHPEDLYPEDPAMKRLFQSFIEAAGGRPAR